MKYCFLLLLAASGCARRQPLPVMGHIPEFQLTAEDGSAFTRAQLDGRIWIADFIFTNCTGPCPMMTTKMYGVEVRLRDLPDLRLVSFTVDPKRDTPEVLAKYAKVHHADPARWRFLTGDPAALSALSRDAFKLFSYDESLTHSTRFVLVDRKARIRGYYSTSDDDGIPNLIRDARALAREAS